ncbi:GTP 3',8-cyclase MoaA [Commensalibacter oyaizuii]|uniref:GTP 3',8-cyclase n=1 Tax=Commensalibacter oyaizuii TaxID=3043873 RepID=A0ABT6Q408_9PROT|nr:GTP 3',8-cyclase MoaA [Commensalibacter sp. TBRC 16381]MDI2091301.1 GTP 3',8-cyclase MoaA [Commensalibacter sp. TBRC 16381]
MLIDNFGRTVDYLRISITDRCNLRCNYCIPKGFKGFEPPDHWISTEEILRVVYNFSVLGTYYFRLTGGEPLLRKDIVELVRKMKAIDQVKDLSMTTNATLLADKAEPLFEAGLNRLNISLDSLNSKHIEEITGSNCLDNIISGLSAAKKAGFQKVRINMVVMPDRNFDEVEEMLRFCIQQQYILCLIEVMPIGESGRNTASIYLQETVKKLEKRFNLQPTTKKIGNGPARYWETENGFVNLGLITPLSQHFCATCNRVRLTVDGTLLMCLGQDNSFQLKPLLRNQCSDEELQKAILQAIKLKPQSHDFLEQPKRINRIMSMTGG